MKSRTFLKTMPFTMTFMILILIVSSTPSIPAMGASGDTNHPVGGGMRITHITVADGLSDTPTTSVVQDRQGFMWIGTPLGGLNRYDGYEFKIYQNDQDNERSISQNHIKVLFIDSQGTLWIGTNGGGLNRYNCQTDDFTRFCPDFQDSSALVDGHEAIWQIRLNKNLKNTKIIGISAAVADKERIELFAADCDAFISKPVDIHILLEVLETQLGIEWICEAVGLSPAEMPPGEVSMPPADVLQDIYKLVEIGDYSGLESMLNELKKDKRYAVFCGKLHQYVIQYDESSIIKLLSHSKE